MREGGGTAARHRLPWRVHLLATGAFAVGTSAYVVSGVLPLVTAEIGVSVSAAGQLTTAFALSYALGAPLLAVLTGRWERRRLLVAALVTGAVGNVLCAVAPNYRCSWPAGSSPRSAPPCSPRVPRSSPPSSPGPRCVAAR